MAIKPEDAFDVREAGLVFADGDGNIKAYFTSGSGDPTGLDAPVPTVYVNEVNAEVWRKFGPGLNDWSLIQGGVVNNGTLTIGGNPVDAVFTPEECVGGTDVNGN